MTTFVNINALIFDMDGLLVDSEPWWRVAEANVFGRLSVTPTEKDFEAMMGNRIQEVIQRWYDRHPWESFSLEKTQAEIVAEVGRLVIKNALLMPGVEDLFHSLQIQDQRSRIKIALASSSPLSLIEKLMKQYGLYENFDIIHSAEFEKAGKPAPDVFLTTAKLLNIAPENCLVFEDSYNGVLAAKNAGMKCIAVPAEEYRNDPRFAIADTVLKSLEEFDLRTLNPGH